MQGMLLPQQRSMRGLCARARRARPSRDYKVQSSACSTSRYAELVVLHHPHKHFELATCMMSSALELHVMKDGRVSHVCPDTRIGRPWPRPIFRRRHTHHSPSRPPDCSCLCETQYAARRAHCAPTLLLMHTPCLKLMALSSSPALLSFIALTALHDNGQRGDASLQGKPRSV